MALAVVYIELPAMIGAFEILAVELSRVEGHPAMRARVAESEWLSLPVSADDQRDLEQRGFVELIAMHAIGGQSAVPETCEHQGIGGLALWEVEFRHGQIVDYRIKSLC